MRPRTSLLLLSRAATRRIDAHLSNGGWCQLHLIIIRSDQSSLASLVVGDLEREHSL
jgi:hypothetical protein